MTISLWNKLNGKEIRTVGDSQAYCENQTRCEAFINKIMPSDSSNIIDMPFNFVLEKNSRGLGTRPFYTICKQTSPTPNGIKNNNKKVLEDFQEKSQRSNHK